MFTCSPFGVSYKHGVIVSVLLYRHTALKQKSGDILTRPLGFLLTRLTEFPLPIWMLPLRK